MKRLINEKGAWSCILLGLVLLLASVGVMLANGLTARQDAHDAIKILQKTQNLMPAVSDCVPEERGNNTMASMEVDGVNVIGVVSFVQYGVTLPLAGEWDTGLVRSMPCRFTGSIYDRSLIIGAVDTENQIYFASRMEKGDRITLSDLEGGRYTYHVVSIQHAKHATLEKLQSGEFDLTVFVKDSKTSEYLLIRCQTGA